jgi:virginiamycin B lyase
LREKTVKRFSYSGDVKSKIVHRIYPFQVLLFLASFFIPLLVPASTALAAVNLTEYPITSSYSSPQQIVTTGGSMWYTEESSSGYVDAIGNVSTSGAITNYSAIPSGWPELRIGSIAADSSGNVWFDACTVSPYDGMYLGKLDASTGAVTMYSVYASDSCESPGSHPGPVTVDPAGNVWVSIFNDPAVPPNTMSLDEFTSSGSLLSSSSEGTGSWSALSVGPSNTLWATDIASNAVDGFTLSPTTDEITASSSYAIPTSSSGVSDITPGSDGNMWFTEDNKNKIGQITPSGTITEYALSSGSDPGGIVSGPDGALWFTASGAVGRITTAGSVTEYSTSNSPNDITAGPDGALWFTQVGGKIGRLGY